MWMISFQVEVNTVPKSLGKGKNAAKWEREITRYSIGGKMGFNPA